jgi:hypothetical protein
MNTSALSVALNGKLDLWENCEEFEGNYVEFFVERPLRVPGRCCFRGLSMRLVSLWWELPPWLDSNSNIWFCGMQEFSIRKSKLF